MVERVFRFARSGGLLAAVTLCLAPQAASALQFTVNQFVRSNLAAAQADFAALIGPDWTFAVTEGFESTGRPVGQIGVDSAASLSTSVGSFTTLGGKGTGTTAIGVADADNGFDASRTDADRGLNLSIRQNTDNDDNGGRQNTSGGLGHVTYLDSNDTLGMKWTASLGGTAFDRLVFTLTDPTDQGKTLTISAAGHTGSFTIAPPKSNGSIFNVLVAFSSTVTSAELSLAKSGVNDGFSIDNATIGAVPLPAAAWLLLAASGGLIAAKRRRERHAT